MCLYSTHYPVPDFGATHTVYAGMALVADLFDLAKVKCVAKFGQPATTAQDTLNASKWERGNQLMRLGAPTTRFNVDE